MIEVELADAKIRILDAGGADNLDLTSAAFEVIEGGFTPVLPNIAQTAEPLLVDADADGHREPDQPRDGVAPEEDGAGRLPAAAQRL
jgi:hypothetical protein